MLIGKFYVFVSEDSARVLGSESGPQSGRQSSVVRIEESVPNYMTIIKSMFSFCYIWGFGGNLHDRYDGFDKGTVKQVFKGHSEEIVSSNQRITLSELDCTAPGALFYRGCPFLP